jgi:RNA polymerase sigma-70 factor (ECF subfamily)
VIQRHNRRLYRVARSVVRDDTEAEDIVQEAYVRAFRNLDGFRGEARLSTWLTRIALNEAVDRLRRRRPQVGLAAIDEAENRREGSLMSLFTGLAAADPEQAASRSEIRRLVEDAVDALPSAFRTVFVLREIEGMSIEETAAQLDLKPETVKTRLHRARRQLRDALEETLATALSDAFPFDGARCVGMTERVLARLAGGEPTPRRPR